MRIAKKKINPIINDIAAISMNSLLLHLHSHGSFNDGNHQEQM